MTALTKDRLSRQRIGDRVADPIAAAVVIYAGSMYVLDGAGDATPATAAATTPVRAVAHKRVALASGDEVTDGRLGVYCFENSAAGAAITRAHIGENAFAVDDQTVANAGTCVAGEILDVDDVGVWVRIGRHVA